MSEAKRYEGPIVPGMKFWTSRSPGAALRTVVRVDHSATFPVRWDDGGADSVEGFRVLRVPAESPAEPPAAPVERALSPGWVKRGKEDWECTHMSGGRYDCVADALWCHGEFKGACVAHAEEMGAFATPAPTVTVTARENLLNGTCSVPAESAPKPAPRPWCVVVACDRTDDRIALRVTTKGGPAIPVCQKCHLDTEERIAHTEETYRTFREPPDDRPRATVGTTPVVFGLSVGILSRGMK